MALPLLFVDSKFGPVKLQRSTALRLPFQENSVKIEYNLLLTQYSILEYAALAKMRIEMQAFT
jgi:hypothetical protein